MKALFVFLSLLWTLPAWALAPGDRVDNFRLLDHHGQSHELRYLSDMRAVVLVSHGNGCPIVRQSLPALRELRKNYSSRGVEFLLVNSNLHDDPASVRREAAEFGIDLPILLDDSQLIGESLGITRTAEVLIIDPKSWKLIYRGPVDDRLALGAQKPAATRHYASDALDALLAGTLPATAQVEAVGCLVEFPQRERRAEHARISYSQQIAPLLEHRCAVCHRPGGIGPWAMTSYQQVRGFAPMIREVIRTRRMPPWHADPHYGSFVGDRSLSTQEAQLLVHWVEAGAPRGEGDDPLARLTPLTSEWPLGEPDLIVEVPAFDVPATGVVNYQYPRVPNPLGRDAWVRAIDIHPGDRAVVHHVLAGVENAGAQHTFVEQLAAFGGYSPGRNPLPYPEDAGVFLPAKANLLFQVHYTPNGKATRDRTRVGYYFHSQPPRHALRLQFIYNGALRIPPGAKAYTDVVSHTFERDVLLYSLMPHAHLRGRAAKFVAHYPDQREETLLSVPTYDFNWQTVYLLQEPKVLPAGTRIEFHMTWDNSAQNPANPDPTRTVPWGDQTWDEMNAGWIRYREVAQQRISAR